MTTGPEVARRFAAALTLLHRREADPVDPAALVGLNLAATMDLQEVRCWRRRNVVVKAPASGAASLRAAVRPAETS